MSVAAVESRQLGKEILLPDVREAWRATRRAVVRNAEWRSSAIQFFVSRRHDLHLPDASADSSRITRAIARYAA